MRVGIVVEVSARLLMRVILQHSRLIVLVVVRQRQFPEFELHFKVFFLLGLY